MATDIDQLRIQINAEATKANDAIDRLVGKLDRLTTSLSMVDGSKLSGLANGVQKLGVAMQTMNNVKTADFTRLSKNLTALNNVDASKLGNLSSNITQIGQSLNGLSGVSSGAKQLTELANGIKQLGYKSADKAITNIPQLAVAMKQLMATLSSAPKVSQNLIDMTNALAKLARTGTSSGRAATSLSSALTTFSKSAKSAKTHSFSLASAIGKVYATYWMLFRAAGKIKDAINISSDLTEVQNVVDTTFGKYTSLVEEMSKTSIEDYGMSELTVKDVASRFQAIGTAMGFAQGKMADMSIELTKLTADMASFYNVEQKDVAEDLESIFTGQTRPLRTYGLDLTEATLKEWALKQGLDANIDSMSQAEKTMLRYQYVLANTGAAQGDFAKTADTWANSVRILKQNFEALGATLGGTFINFLKPVVKALNVVIGKLREFAKVVSSSLGVIFGWKYEDSGGGVASDWEDAESAAGGIADSTGKTAKNLEKIQKSLRAFDELNVINLPDNNSSGGGSGSGGGGSSAGGSGGEWTKVDSIFKNYESELDTLYKLGDYIGNALTKTLEDIDWDGIYEKARNFGTGLADFLNGLFSPELFGAVGSTIASTLNTAIYASLKFTETFDFTDFGASLAKGINDFFATFDFSTLAKGMNAFVDGLEETIASFLKNVSWEDIVEKSEEFLNEIEFDTVAVVIGGFALRAKKGTILSTFSEALKLAIRGGVALGSFTIKFGKIVALIGTPQFYVFGEWILESITDVLEKLIPKWALDLLGSIGAGIVAGAIGGSWFPGAGTIAGGIIGGIMGALAGVKIDGKPVLIKIFNAIFNWDYTKRLLDNTKKFFKKMSESFESHDWLSIGKNLVLGILNGIGAGLAFIVEPIGDFFASVWDAICDVFGIHSPAEEMEPLGKNILLGVVKGFTDSFASMSKAISDFFANVIKPWFSVEKWKSNMGSIKDALLSKWEQAKSWWETKSKLSEVTVSIFNIKNKLSEAWTIARSWWNNNKPSLSAISANIKLPHLVVTWNTTSAAAKALQKLGLNGFPNFSVRYYANGGFPEDGWFRANHGEMLGKFDNGKSVVANNKQITDGISSAVYQGNHETVLLLQQELAESRRQNELLSQILAKEFGITKESIGRAAQDYANDYFARTGREAYSV